MGRPRVEPKASHHLRRGGLPLTICPQCGSDLTLAEALSLCFTNKVGASPPTWEDLSDLDEWGEVADYDGHVAKGLLAEVVCAACDNSLSEFDTVKVGEG